MNLLREIIGYKRTELEARKLLVSEQSLMESKFFDRQVISLKEILSKNKTTGIIAEFKRRSPSLGIINSKASVYKVTHDYSIYGAAGLSVLTDNHFFGGTTEDLVTARENEIPILRKEFIIDQYQLLASKAMGADVILLIAACLEPREVSALSAYAKRIGLEVLLEIHSEKELDHICDSIDMVGINNRNLETFAVDINRSITLSKLIPDSLVKIAESGIGDTEIIKKFKDAGFSGFLIGELFMKEQDPGAAFKRFNDQLKLI